MTNRARGEFILAVDGQEYTLCLTLGALADLEETLGIEDITQIAERFSERPRAKDILAFLTALARGGGHTEVDESTFASLSIADMAAALTSIQGAMTAAVEGEARQGKPQEPRV